MTTRTSLRLGASLLVIATSSLASAGGVVLQPKAGAPLDGLSQVQIDRFWGGRISYATPFTPANGLGPIMNKSNCQSCHSNPVGGWGSIGVTRFGTENKGEFIPLEELGGSLLQALSISDECRENLPPEATVTATRMTNSSMAFGLIEAIPDGDIAAHEDPLDADGDGISGRVHWVLPLESSPTSPLRAGRFGWKAQVATVLTFSADATRNELGVTNALITTENAPNGDAALLGACDTAADPEDHADETGFTYIERVTHFQRYLAQPPQTPKAGMTGETVFNSIGCAKCHIAEWTTVNSKSLEGALRGKTIRPYSDFLLHDMGFLGDGVQDGDANEQEIRTPTLWNLRTRDPMLHNGSVSGGVFADRVSAAIAAHGPIGEGAASAAAFSKLTTAQRAQLIAFLDSLGRVEFDFNGNGSVDIEDLHVLASYRGATGVTADSAAAIGDLDRNGTIGQVDVNGFLAAAARDGLDPTADCDGDGIVDFVEIYNGSPDADFNGVPDDCVVCPADLDHNGQVGAADIAILLNNWGAPGQGDLDHNGITNAVDIALLLGNWGPCH